MAEYIEREAAIKLIASDKTEISPLLCALVPTYTAEQAFDGLNQSCDRHIKFINSIPSADVQPVKWIPVTERMPEEIGWYLVKVEAPYRPIRIYKYEPTKGDYSDNLWRNGDGIDGCYVFNWFVTHWMLLPEPPKDGEA